VNGLALCKNHHWAFDHGWFGIDDDYRILIPWNRYVEEVVTASRSMMDFRGEKINLPSESKFIPSKEAFKWHREIWRIN
jgi:putative restriction endonuclease